MKNFLFLVVILIVATCFSCNNGSAISREYYVSKSGNDNHDGTKEKPFLTIQKAADVVMLGDVVTIQEGIYREAVIIRRGGNSEDSRIVFQSAQGADVRIMGSEKFNDWTKLEDGIWKAQLDTSFFKGFNPFNTLTRHPEHVAVDESGDGWGWLKYGRWTHLGDIILDGKGLTERQYLKEISENEWSWYTSTEQGTTTIWANFGNKDPNLASVEINSRPFAFQPDSSGYNYITIRGLRIQNIANHWAPPTVYQPGAIWANGGHHWVIEDNIILYAQGAAISIGIPNGSADQSLSGHHTILNNVIMRCGQGATTGQVWNSHSVIEGNHIEQINYRKEFGGWETAGIKHHGANHLTIKNNFIRGVYTMNLDTGAAHGIWNDYQNTNWNVAGNIIMNTEGHAILTEANWEGPNLYMNNVIFNGSIGSYSSRGDAWAHNLLLNSKQIWQNQPWGDRPQIGNIRWVNNIFVAQGPDSTMVAKDAVYSSNVYLDGADVSPKDLDAIEARTLSEFQIIESVKGIDLIIFLPEAVLNSEYPAIAREFLELPFEFEITQKDFAGNEKDNHLAGPFSNLQPGKNIIRIYEYPQLYLEALDMIGE